MVPRAVDPHAQVILTLEEFDPRAVARCPPVGYLSDFALGNNARNLAAADLPLLLEKAESFAFVHERGAWTHRDADSRECVVRYAPPERLGGIPVVKQGVSGC